MTRVFKAGFEFSLRSWSPKLEHLEWAYFWNDLQQQFEEVLPEQRSLTTQVLRKTDIMVL
jgi:hypothetical protein